MNVNSLLKHIDEIRHVLRSTPFDIFAINESKIDESIPHNEISIPGYKLIIIIKIIIIIKLLLERTGIELEAVSYCIFGIMIYTVL